MAPPAVAKDIEDYQRAEERKEPQAAVHFQDLIPRPALNGVQGERPRRQANPNAKRVKVPGVREAEVNSVASGMGL